MIGVKKILSFAYFITQNNQFTKMRISKKLTYL